VILWNAQTYGADQEAFITLTQIDTSSEEIGVMLKVQSLTTAGDGYLEVFYDPASQAVLIGIYDSSQGAVLCGNGIRPPLPTGTSWGRGPRPTAR